MSTVRDKMKTIKDITIDTERAFYNNKETSFTNIKIDGPADGESAFKECSNITVTDSFFNLRYPFWHCTNLAISNIEMTENCRASLWYDYSVDIKDSKMLGIKAFRECNKIKIENCEIVSPEFGLRCADIIFKNSSLDSVYAFFECKNLILENIKFVGKYSFQYVENMNIVNSELDTKDAFWHTKNVTVKDSIIKGEYLGWYSENLTLINCKIIGTQPLCYCKNLKLIDCTTEDCDLAFEYSEVNGSVIGDVVSVKNPLSGKLTISGKTTLIVDENDRSNNKFELIYNR